MGKRVLELPPEIADRLLQALGDADEYQSALGLALQLVEEAGASVPSWLSSRALALSQAAFQSAGKEPMTEFYVEKRVANGFFNADAVVELWALRMRTITGLAEDVDHS